jgi:hypothetical protein
MTVFEYAAAGIAVASNSPMISLRIFESPLARGYRGCGLAPSGLNDGRDDALRTGNG